MPAYKNEDLPLDLKSGTYQDSVSGTLQSIPLLDQKWIEDEEVEFITYIPPPVKVSLLTNTSSDPDKTEQAEWEERTNFILNDLKWLLCQSHSQFWNQVIFNKSVNVCLDSFLKLTPRSFDVWKFLPEHILSLQKQIHRSVFMVYLRMSTHKESKSDFFTPATFGEILYENFLFDIPKVMDLCAIYGGEESGNTSLLTKMLGNVFSNQPMYIDDLFETMPSVFQTFVTIGNELGGRAHNDHGVSEKLTKERPSGLKLSTVNDLVVYLLDICHTLLSLFHTLPTLCEHFFKAGLVQHLAAFYEESIPFLEEKYRGSEHKTARNSFKRCKLGLIKICRLIIVVCCIEPMLNSKENSDRKECCIEEFLTVVMELISFKEFLVVYNTHQSIALDVDIIRSCGLVVDETRIQYIMSAVSAPRSRVKPNKMDSMIDRTELLSEAMQTSQVAKATETTRVDDEELNSMVSHVKDLLPDYGEGFILLCLRELNYDVEHVVSLILEDALPAQLNNFDRQLSKSDIANSSSVLSTRHSVYDHDEFDVFSKDDVDLSRVHKGKSRHTDNVRTVLDDKQHIESVKEVILSYDESFNDYEDDYDDTYDTQDVGAQDADSADELAELTARRSFTTPVVLRNINGDSSDDQEQNEECEDGSSGDNARRRPDSKETKKSDPGPRRDKSERGHRRNAAASNGKRDSRSSNERDRAYKDKHKGKIANHNRKTASAKKHARGMAS